MFFLQNWWEVSLIQPPKVLLKGATRRRAESTACSGKKHINRAETLENQIILVQSQGTAPCLSSGEGCISTDTYSACRLGKT